MTTATTTALSFSVLKENLSAALAIVGRTIGDRKTPLPISTHVLLETNGDWLTLRSTDLMGFTTHLTPAKVEGQGAVCLPFDRLRDFVAALPNDRIDFALAENGRNVTITCARRTARIAGIEASEFPPARTAPTGSVEITIAAPVLREGLRRVIKNAAAGNDPRPVLRGVYMAFKGATLTLATADGFRLAEQRLTLPEPVDEPRTALIPATLMSEVYGLLAKEDGQVTIMLPPNGSAGSFVHFVTGRTDIACIQVEGMFPSYQQLIPRQTSDLLTLDCTELTNAVRTVATLGEGRLRLLPHQGEPGSLTITAKGEVDNATSEIDAILRGSPSKIALMSGFALDALDALGPGQITLQTSMPSSPMVFRKVDDADYLHVIMPLFVEWGEGAE